APERVEGSLDAEGTFTRRAQGWQAEMTLTPHAMAIVRGNRPRRIAGPIRIALTPKALTLTTDAWRWVKRPEGMELQGEGEDWPAWAAEMCAALGLPLPDGKGRAALSIHLGKHKGSFRVDATTGTLSWWGLKKDPEAPLRCEGRWLAEQRKLVLRLQHCRTPILETENASVLKTVTAFAVDTSLLRWASETPALGLPFSGTWEGKGALQLGVRDLRIAGRWRAEGVRWGAVQLDAEAHGDGTLFSGQGRVQIGNVWLAIKALRGHSRARYARALVQDLSVGRSDPEAIAQAMAALRHWRLELAPARGARVELWNTPLRWRRGVLALADGELRSQAIELRAGQGRLQLMSLALTPKPEADAPLWLDAKLRAEHVRAADIPAWLGWLHGSLRAQIDAQLWVRMGLPWAQSRFWTLTDLALYGPEWQTATGSSRADKLEMQLRANGEAITAPKILLVRGSRKLQGSAAIAESGVLSGEIQGEGQRFQLFGAVAAPQWSPIERTP
ncbi:MAG: hypothetical protein D6771_09550, partial [Zetaproteobacteria bacterium]